jgi:hypothetical protein
MRLPQLFEHLKLHGGKIRTITAHDCINTIASEPVSRVNVVLFENLIIYVQICIMRMSTLEGPCVEIHAGVINNPGYIPNVRMNINMYDLCTSNMMKVSAELHSVEVITQIHKVHYMHCYDNFVDCKVSVGANVDDQWTRSDFLKHCGGKVFMSEQDFETTRIVALVFQFERMKS